MPTKLLLLEDVEDLGRKGEIVDVKPGYARNFLLPRQKGIFADKRALRMQVRLQEERKKQLEEERKEAEKVAKDLEGIEIETHVKVDPQGHMYGSVTVLDILRLIEEKTKIKVEKRAVQLKHPIKKTGTHPIELNLLGEIPVSLTLKVIAEKEEQKEE